MNINLSYKGLDPLEAVEKEVGRHSGKLGKLLKSYQGDLVQLHGAFEKHPRRIEYAFSLNLALGVAGEVRGSVKKAFADLERQIKKHQEKLRHDYEWKRKRPRAFATAL